MVLGIEFINLYLLFFKDIEKCFIDYDNERLEVC